MMISFLFLSCRVMAQEPGEELITWKPDQKLTWDDYKGKPDPGSDAAASTTTYLSIEYNIGERGFGYKIRSRFSKTRSWGLHKTMYILSHEQGHFDIAEVFARKLHRLMKAYTFNRAGYKTELKKIYEGILEEKEAMQDAYDRETRHSINKEKQAEWLEKIRKLLEEYEEYKDY